MLSQKPNQQSNIDDSDDDYGEELDLHRGFDRPKLVKLKNLWDDDTELPERITKRLEEIRVQALHKYRETCYTKA